MLMAENELIRWGNLRGLNINPDAIDTVYICASHVISRAGNFTFTVKELKNG